jgi:hypothetical protein
MRAPVLKPEPVEEQAEVKMTRRERRAAARGGAASTGPIPVKAGPKLPPPPVRHRDYASRKRG